MKNFQVLFFVLVLLFISGCTNKDFAETKNYYVSCEQGDKTACSRYLFLSTYDVLIKESFESNIDKQDFSYWKKRYLNVINNDEDAYVAIKSMVESLDDPYTIFLTPDEFADQNMSIDAKVKGIGVVIGSIDGKIVVIEVMDESPAKKSGLETGDVIIGIDGKSTSGFDTRTAASLIRGEENTTVSIKIMRDKKVLNFNILRKEIKLRAVKAKMLDDDILYLKINTFMSNKTSGELLYEVRSHKNAKKIIIDLRNNHGGLLQNAIQIANLFLKKGKIVSVVKKNEPPQIITADKILKSVDVPMVVLVNGSSASASEILAGALKENDRAVLVGEKTYGKGLVQRVVELPSGAGINVTIAKYLTPNGNDINKKGIEPNFEIKNPKRNKVDAEDLQLQKAIEIVNSILY